MVILASIFLFILAGGVITAEDFNSTHKVVVVIAVIAAITSIAVFWGP